MFFEFFHITFDNICVTQPGMTEELREKMGASATNAALAVSYVGAGTVEFLVDPSTFAYYFMEMNTPFFECHFE